MRFEQIEAGRLMTDRQRQVVQSCFPLVGMGQNDWAKSVGLEPAALSKMLRGHWAVRAEYADAMNDLVARIHPIDVAA